MKVIRFTIFDTMLSIANAVAEKIASLKTMDHLQNRADRSSMDEMMRIMDKVEDREPMELGKL